MTRTPRIALCFFGITRSLRRTMPSIEANILAPAAALGEVGRFAHFFRLDRIVNPRSGEAIKADPEEFRLIKWDSIELEEPEHCLATHGYNRIVAYGDCYGDNHKSTKNLLHQLHSLGRVTAIASAWQPDMYVFCRPDLEYLDDFGPCMRRTLRTVGPVVNLPYWQWFDGYNDRFAIVKGMRTAWKYGGRAAYAVEYCATGSRPLHAERLLKYALRGERVRMFRVQARRVRATGV